LIKTIIKISIPCLCIIWGIISILRLGKCDYNPACGVPLSEFYLCRLGLIIGIPLGIILGIVFLAKA
jgi:hypothetical protein